MASTAAQAVMDRLESDEAFAERLKGAGGPGASIALLESEGFDVTPQELRDALLDRYGDELTPEQLDAVAGGSLHDDPVASGVFYGLAAAAVAASLAAV